MGMKCESENCDNEATVHLTEIRDGKKIEMHLCEKCAAAKGLPGKTHFSISELLAGIASQSQANAQGQQGGRTRKGKEAGCPACGTTLSQFQASGRFGCPDCYTSFKDDVQSLVEKIHDASQHIGKVPRRVSSEISLQKDIRQLQLELKRAVRREDYEKAAAIRDQIRQLEERLQIPHAASVSGEDDTEPAGDAGEPGSSPSGEKTPGPSGGGSSTGGGSSGGGGEKSSRRKSDGGEKK